MTLWRWLKDASLQFPKPVYTGNRRYWHEEQILNWISARSDLGGGGPVVGLGQNPTQTDAAEVTPSGAVAASPSGERKGDKARAPSRVPKSDRRALASASKSGLSG